MPGEQGVSQLHGPILKGPIFKLGAVLSCKEVNKMLASGMKLTFIQRVKLWCHLRICDTCKKFSQHLKILSNAFRFFCATDSVKSDQVKKLEESVLREIGR